MLASPLLLAAVTGLVSASPAPSGELAAEAPVHLGISLAVIHRAELARLLAAQQDPRSPDYRRWLTPAEFAERFGQPLETYAAVGAWLRAAGLEVGTSPGRTFIEASGTAAQVDRLLAVRLLSLTDEPRSVHVADRAPRLPEAFAAQVVNVSGLDTRIRFRRHLVDTAGNRSLGPQDLRRLYDLTPLLDAGFVGQGQQTVVLSTALPAGGEVSLPDVEYFLGSLSDSVTPLNQIVLSNPANDVDSQVGANTEFELDLEMQSVGNAAGQSLTLLVSPASEVFTTGAAYIANSLPGATSVSVSLGTCEPLEMLAGLGEATALQGSLLQGLAEGQTWSAAAGDSGADDCQGQATTAAASVDFPACEPLMVAAGGSEITSPAWDANSALLGYQTEVAWNDGAGGGAGGGGVSTLFPAPTYQLGLPLSDGGRLVPDLALMAGAPGVIVDSALPGQLSIVAGTSVASPLAAGFFALIASRVGCRLGDVHPTLYALGQAQLDGGAKVFHDLTSGNNTYGGVQGFAAGLGFDEATGWGSLDVAALAEAWPPCPATDGGLDAGVLDGGTPVASYSQCGVLACDGGTTCVTLSAGEGPSSCIQICDPLDAGSCAPGLICSTGTPYASGAGGQCIPGCLRDSDCGDGGQVCNLCQETCEAAGNPAAHIGDACTTSTQCPSGGVCETGRAFPGGFCTQVCSTTAVGGACGCPATSFCAGVGFGGADLCVESCDNPGGFCARSGYICQPRSDGTAACLPPCHVTTRGDTCLFRYGSSLACEADSGICGGPVMDAGSADAGSDAGTPDSGVDAGADAGLDAGLSGPDAGPTPDAGVTAKPASGCGCTSGAGDPSAFALLAFGVLSRRRLRSRASLTRDRAT